MRVGGGGYEGGGVGGVYKGKCVDFLVKPLCLRS